MAFQSNFSVYCSASLSEAASLAHSFSDVFPDLPVAVAALQVASVTRALSGAYHVVESVFYDRAEMVITVAIYTNADKTRHLRTCKYRIQPVDIGGGNPIAAAYLYLKTLPDFAGAVDC